MSEDHVNYDEVAPTYDQRYQVNPLADISATLQNLIREIGAAQVLEVGCGTGRWLPDIQAVSNAVYGLDISLHMLAQARERIGGHRLVCGAAKQLPFRKDVFDLVFCVNALHHFDDRQGFILEARRILRPAGAVAVIGMNPHAEGQREGWCIYHYFPGTYETDVRRYPSPDAIKEWMRATGFARTDCRVAAHIVNHKAGRAILEDPFIQKHATSQLILLSDEDYQAGLRRMEAAIVEAEAAGETIVFSADIPLMMVVGWLS